MLEITGVLLLTATSTSEADDAPHALLATTLMFPPALFAVSVMLSLVLVPFHPAGMLHV
jgi:hypothetical protein